MRFDKALCGLGWRPMQQTEDPFNTDTHTHTHTRTLVSPALVRGPVRSSYAGAHRLSPSVRRSYFCSVRESINDSLTCLRTFSFINAFLNFLETSKLSARLGQNNGLPLAAF